MQEYSPNQAGRPAQQVRQVTQWLGRLPRQLGVIFSGLASLVKLVLKRMWNHFGLSGSAILGVIAVLSIVIAVPVFSYSISSEVLFQELALKSITTGRNLFSVHLYYIDDYEATAMNLDKVGDIKRYLNQASAQLLDLDTENIIMEAQTTAFLWFPEELRGDIKAEEPWVRMAFTTQESLPAKAVLVEGSWPEETADPEKSIQVAIMESAANRYFINLGDRFHNGPMQVEVVGIWRPGSLDPSAWYDPPKTAYRDVFWVRESVFSDVLPKFIERPVFYAYWYVTIDDSELQYDQVTQYTQGMIRMSGDLTRMLPGIAIDYSPMEALEVYDERALRLTNLFYAVGGPMVVLALLFIAMAGSIAVQQYEQETATMRGRGTSWIQVISLNLIESLILIAIALPMSFGAGWLEAYLMSRTQSFLNFSGQGGVLVNFQGLNPIWILVAVAVIILARLIPALSISRSTLIQVKQEQSRNTRKPLWQRLYLDFLLLIPGLYAYLTLNGLADPGAYVQELYDPVSAAEPYRDPLLFVAPALFAMAVCLISLRFIPFIFRLIAALIDHLPGVWPYLAVQDVARRPQEHTNALLLILVSLSLSIYSASVAKTLDKWLHDAIFYEHGADLVVHEYVIDHGDTNFGSGAAMSTLSEFDLNVTAYLSLEDHLKLPAVDGATRVGKYPGSYSYGVGESDAIFMGIDRLDFPYTAFYRDDFADISLGALMNALGSERNSIIVPRWLAEEKGFQSGDRLYISANVLDQTYDNEMVVSGYYDYFPTVYPVMSPTFIVNLDTLFANPDAVIGYEIWLDLVEGSDTEVVTGQIRDKMNAEGAVVDVPGNSLEDLEIQQEEPERVGVFGVLNVGFLATGLMPGIGFLLYSYASLRRRFIQLGILQALGLSISQLIGYLVLEQFLLMSLAMLIGAGVGLLVCTLFLPFLQVGVGATIPPFYILIGWAETSWLILGFGLVLLLTIIGTIIYLVRMKVFQAVKMGETL